MKKTHLLVFAIARVLVAGTSWAAPFGGPTMSSIRRRCGRHRARLARGRRVGGTEALGGPGLGGQHDWYLSRQLKNFKAGVRGVHEKDTYGQTMSSMAHALPPDEQTIKDVVAYIETLK